MKSRLYIEVLIQVAIIAIIASISLTGMASKTSHIRSLKIVNSKAKGII